MNTFSRVTVKIFKTIGIPQKSDKYYAQVIVSYLISLMKVKSSWSVKHHTSNYRLENCQFNMVSYGTHSVLDTPDLWANIVVHVTGEFPIQAGNEKQNYTEQRKKCVFWKRTPICSEGLFKSMQKSRVRLRWVHFIITFPHVAVNILKTMRACHEQKNRKEQRQKCVV